MANVAEEIRNLASENLKKIIADKNMEDLPHRCFVRQGLVDEEIKQTIEKNNIDLVVMGTKGSSSDAGIFMGSLTKTMIQHANCPVLAIPEHASKQDFSKIVYCTELKQDETSILNYLIEFARLYNAQITVLHVDPNKTNVEWSIEELKKIVDKSDYPNISYHELIGDLPEEAITKYIKENDTSMLAMTTYTTTLFDKLVHRSLTKKMVMHSHIPLLAFNRKSHSTILLS